MDSLAIRMYYVLLTVLMALTTLITADLIADRPASGKSVLPSLHDMLSGEVLVVADARS